MRIVHFSDIHLSKSNYNEYKNYFKTALIGDLKAYNSNIPIDLIVITGDLVDKGGHSLFDIEEFNREEFEGNPFKVFEKVFIEPIAVEISIPKSRFLFVPGNHDVDEKQILWFDESELQRNITETNIENYLQENLTFKHSKRIEKFKQFEKEFHINTPNYIYSSNQSVYIHEIPNNHSVGFILLNDSWRCKSRKFEDESNSLFFGVNQLHSGLEILGNTNLNICIMHHDLSDYQERNVVEKCLVYKNIELFLFGHHHRPRTENWISQLGSCIGFRGRATLFKPNEVEESYQSGYQIIDIEMNTKRITSIHYRKYIHQSGRFDMDTNTAHQGIENGKEGKGFDISRPNEQLPSLNLNINDFKQATE